MITLFYVNKRGAHTMRTFSTAAACWEFMQNLRTRAVAKSNGEVVGRIEHRTDGYQDQPGPRKWFGWIEDDAPEEKIVRNYIGVAPQDTDTNADMLYSQALASQGAE
jgi:hypothetical protein